MSLFEKSREKTYQEIEERTLKIPFKEHSELFKHTSNVVQAPELTEDQVTLLKKAYASSKSVPRQNGRNRWREKAGHATNMLLEQKFEKGFAYIYLY